MSVRRLGVVVLLLTALTAAGCSSSGGSGGTPTPSPSISASTLAAKIRHGLSGITSAHVSLDAGTIGGRSNGVFAFQNGKPSASDLHVRTGSYTLEVVSVGSTSYAKLPAGKHPPGKPWVKVSPNSKNQLVKNLATTLPLVTAVGSLNQLSGIVAGATSVRDEGATTLNGRAAHRYSLTISPNATGSGQLHDLLHRLGGKPVPAKLWLDSKDRPIRIQLSVNVAGTPFPLVIAIDQYNQPVHIQAPPASQISG